MNVYVMKRIWFKFLVGVCAVTGLGIAVLVSPNNAQAFQAESTPPGLYVTVTYPDPINVRGGPSTVHYPIVGQLAPGAVVPALGVSPGHEWVQISFPQSPSGTGWVYAIFVTVSGGELQVVEPPPTPTPPVTATFDLTLAAAFNVQPTQTRLPTFTPPPPLTVPQFTPEASTHSSGVFGVFILGLGLIGGAGLLVSFVLRK
jgi:SH3 domain-containing protein